MNEILKIFFSLSVSGTVIALILFGLKPFLKSKFSKTWQYYIWLIVIIRLLFPFSMETNIIGQLFSEMDKTITVQNEVLEPINDIPIVIDNFTPQLPQVNQNVVIQQENTTNYWNEIKSNLWLVWLVIAIMLLVRKITSYHSFVRYIKAGINEVSDNKVLEIFKTTCIATGLKKPLRVYTNPLANSAMLVGIYKPFVVVPDIEIGEMELQNIFTHELTHYKRLDIFYKWFTQLAVCLHWYNPIVYLVSREINKNCELSCDEAIIKKLDDKGKRSYGDTLLASLKGNGNYGNTIISITLNEDAELLKERLGAIMKFKKKSKLTVISSTFLAVLIFSVSAIIGAYAGVNNPTPTFPAYQKEKIDDTNVLTLQPIEAINDSNKPAMINYTKIVYDDTAYKWPYIQHSVTNNSDLNITSVEIGSLAFDKDGNPLELYWDARNLAANGDVGSVGFGDGVDYGIVTGIKPYSPKSYYWLYDWDYQEVRSNETKIYDGWPLFDGWWDQPDGIHIANYLISNIKKVTFEDGTVWENSEYDYWLESYKGKSIELQELQSYYPNILENLDVNSQNNTIDNSSFQLERDEFFSSAWISYEGQSASNIVVEFPTWYTRDMWDVKFIWGDYAIIPIDYNINTNSLTLGVGHDTNYGLEIALPNEEILVIDLRELERNLKSNQSTNGFNIPTENQYTSPTNAVHESGITANNGNNFLSGAYISNEFQSASNITLKFPAWYTSDMWDVHFIWGDYAIIPLNYNHLDDNNSLTLGVGHDTNYGLEIALPNEEILVIDLRELERNLKSNQLTNRVSIPVTNNNVIYRGGVAANNRNFGNPFPAKMGDIARFSLAEELSGWGLDQDEITIRVVIGGNDGTTQDIILSNKEPEKEILIREDANHHITIHNPNNQLVNYNFSLTLISSSNLNSNQSTNIGHIPATNQTISPNDVVYQGGVAANNRNFGNPFPAIPATNQAILPNNSVYQDGVAANNRNFGNPFPAIPATNQAILPNNSVYQGGVAANNRNFGNPFPAKKGDIARFSLAEELSGWGLNQDEITIRVVIGGNDGTTQDIILSNKEPEKEILIREDANHHITIHNPNNQLVNYNFTLTLINSTN